MEAAASLPDLRRRHADRHQPFPCLQPQPDRGNADFVLARAERRICPEHPSLRTKIGAPGFDSETWESTTSFPVSTTFFTALVTPGAMPDCGLVPRLPGNEFSATGPTGLRPSRPAWQWLPAA